MALNDETIRLILQTSGFESVEQLTKALKGQKIALEDVAETYEVLASNAHGYELAEESVSTAIVETTSKQKALTAAIEETHTATTQVTTATGRMNQSTISASYAFQDFTSQLGNQGLAGALRAVQNNIPGILSGTSLTTGWIAGISAAAVAVGLLVDAWSNWNKELEKDNLEKAKKDMDELKKSAEEFQALVDKPTKAEAVGGKMIGEAIKEGDPAKIARVLQGELAREGKGEQMTREEQETVKRLTSEAQAFPGDERKTEQLTRILTDYQTEVAERIRQADITRIQKALGDVQKGGDKARAARGLLTPLAAAGPAGLPQGFLGDLEKSSPEYVKYQQELETYAGLRQAGKERDDKAKDARQKEVDRNKKAADSDADRFNKQFEHEVEVARKEQERKDEQAENAGIAGVAALERIGHAGARQGQQRRIREEGKRQREAEQAAKHGMRAERQEQENVNADIERALNRANQAEIETAKANGATKQVVEWLTAKADREREQAADTRRYWSRFMQAQEQTAQGGGPH